MKTKQNKSIDMTHGPMFLKMIFFAIPLAISSMLQLLFNAADTVVVGRFAGELALAAVGSNGSLVFLIISMFNGLSIGSNVLVARYRGKGDEDMISDVVHTSVAFAIFGGIFLVFFGSFIAPRLLLLMSVPADVLPLSTMYLRIYFLGVPFMLLYNFGASILRSIGDTQRPLIFLTIAGVINVCLNLVFVIVFKMSVAGVALATGISQVVSSMLVMRTLMHEEGALKLELKKVKINFKTLGDIAKIGLPAGIQGSVFSISNIAVQSGVNSFGSIVIAGNSAAANLEGFMGMGINAFSQAAMTFSSQNYGAKKYKRCDRALSISVIMCIILAVTMGGGFLFLGPTLLSFYTTNPEVIATGMTRLKYMCTFQTFNGLMDIMTGGLRGIGFSLIPTIVTLTGVCGLRLVWINTIFKSLHTIDILYMVYPVSWIITTSIHTIVYFIGRRNLRLRGDMVDEN